MTWSDGTVCLHDGPLFADPGAWPCRLFLQRLFQLDEVRSVEIDRSRGTARIAYDPQGRSVDDMLDRMNAALRTDLNGSARSRPPVLPRAEGSWTTLRVTRFGPILTSWEVVHASPGRIRLRNVLLRTDEGLAARVVRELSAVHGIEQCHVRRLTASLLVRYDAGTLDTRRLVRFLDRLLEGSGHALAHPDDPSPVPFTIASCAVGLAAAGELALPALLPASALLLVATNVPTIRAAWDEIRRRQVGLPVLSTTIIAGTLASGQFLAAALMAWLVKFWQHRHRARLFETRRSLLPGIAQHHRFARLDAREELEILLEDLTPGHQIVVSAGEIIPVDGRVIGGFGLVNEGLLRGRAGLSPKRRGTPVFAGTRVHDGTLRVVVERVGVATRAAAFAAALAGAAVPARSRSAVTAHGEAFGRRAVVPTLATAGVGLLVGDLTTAAAVLRPDYATGPGLGVALEQLQDVAECARRGIIVRDPSALPLLAQADVILFDDHPALTIAPLEVEAVHASSDADERAALRYAATALRGIADERAEALGDLCATLGIEPLAAKAVYGAAGFLIDHDGRFVTVADARDPGAAALALTVFDGSRPLARICFGRGAPPHAAFAVEDLRRIPDLTVGLLSSAATAAAQELGDALGIDHVWGELTAEGRRALIRSFRARGLKVVYVGECPVDDATVREADVAVALAEDFEPRRSSAAIVFLGRDISGLAWLREFARSHVSRVRTVYGSTLIPNLACVAGAFLFGFTSMASVIITNLGTWGVYSRLPHRARRRTADSLPRRRRTRAGGLRYNGVQPWPEGNTSCEPIPALGAPVRD